MAAILWRLTKHCVFIGLLATASEADDVAAAKKQVAAMAKATTTLKAATDKAEQESA